MVKSFFTNRKQRVVIDGITSNWEQIHQGVPQGVITRSTPILELNAISDIKLQNQYVC